MNQGGRQADWGDGNPRPLWYSLGLLMVLEAVLVLMVLGAAWIILSVVLP